MGAAESTDLTMVQNFIDEQIKNNKVVVFSKTTCGFCGMAKRTLDEAGVDYKTFELNQMKDGSAIQNALSRMTGASTVPRVFINGKCIGGGTETRNLHRTGELQRLLQQSA